MEKKSMPKTRKVAKSAITGRFVKKSRIYTNPRTTFLETVKTKKR